MTPQSYGSIQSVSGTTVNIGLGAPTPPPIGSKTQWSNSTPYSVTFVAGAGGAGTITNIALPGDGWNLYFINHILKIVAEIK